MINFWNKIFHRFNANKEAQKYNDSNIVDYDLAKQIATEKKEPYIAVLNTHVNSDNVRNGFFELDWNEYFIIKLRQSGYKGVTEEEIVDQWFQDLCRNIGDEIGVEMERRGSGFVNRALRDDGKSEIG